MVQAYIQRVWVTDHWEDRYPETSAAQVVTDDSRQFVTAAEKASYAAKEDAANKNQPGGYAGLDEEGRLPLNAIPALLEHNKGYFATGEALKTAHESAEAGDFAIVGATDTVWIWDADSEPAGWVNSANRGSVISVNGKTGAVTITWDDLNAPDATTTAKGVVQLSSATDSDSEALAATPKAVKAVMDAVNAKPKLTVGTAAPENPAEGDIWLDTSMK